MGDLQGAQSGVYTIGNDVLDWLLTKQTTHGEEGARAARRLVEEEVVSLMSKALLDQPKKRRWNLKVRKNKLALV